MATTESKQPTCKERVREHFRGRMADLRALLDAQHKAGRECEACDGSGDTFDVVTGEVTGDCPDCSGQGRYDEDGRLPNLGTLNEYGLGFDYVAPNTFNGQRRGYWRYQLSWGGPSDEFRFYCDESRRPVRVEYWFMDWGDGASVRLTRGKDFDLLMALWEDWQDTGTVDHVYSEAMQDA